MIMLEGAQLCDVTPTGLVLLAERGSGALVLSRLGDDDSLDELTRLPSLGGLCGLVSHQPGEPVIWVVSSGWFGVEPDRLHRVDLDGTLSWSAALEYEGGLIRTYALTTHAGQQFLGGRLVYYDQDGKEIDPLGSQLVLQSRDEDQVAWTQVGYAGVSPDTGGAAQNGLFGLVWSEAGLSFMGHKSWLDSATVSLFTVNEQDGEPTGVALLGSDVSAWDRIALSSDRDQRVYVGERRSSYADDPARSIINAYVSGHSLLWSTPAEWAGWSELQASEIMTVGGRLVGAVSVVDVTLYLPGGRRDRRVHVVSHSLGGEFDCRQELYELRGWSIGELSLAGEGRLVLGLWWEVEPGGEQREQALAVFDVGTSP
ncbi:hypothetical protein DB30_07437 [Enhygromyxa salina]|uniref:Uncharacterized protein n=1 Tax=Enhygromyxa salina TaxID=215803 RepID=A0A0C1Z8B5_9BACT|nr:hypothetical protein DB30_07437 [Enhygromyxa salina]